MSAIELDILTDDPNYQLICKYYWQLDSEGSFQYSVSDIARQFGLKTQKLSQTVAQFSRAYSSQIKCKECGTKYIFENRSDFQRFSLQGRIWLCSKCAEISKQKEISEKQELEKRQEIIINKRYDLKNRTSCDFSQISFEDAITLLSLIRAGASEDFQYISPIWTIKEPIAPNVNFLYELIRQIYRNDLIYVHPSSSPDAFEFENDQIKSFYLDRVVWALPVGHESSEPRDAVAELDKIFLNMDWPNEWFDQRLDFCKKIALQECLQYLEFSLADHQLSFSPGEKTFLVINNLLEDFSVAQIYNFIWRAAKDAAAFYVRERVPKQHAANTVVGSMQRQAERARSERWDVKPYRRDFRCPQSMISQVLYNTALHIGDDGFNKPLK